MIVVLHVSKWNVYHVTLLNRITGFIAVKENNIDKINLDISIILLLKLAYFSDNDKLNIHKIIS